MKTKHILALLTLPMLAACSEDLYTDKFDSSSIIITKTPAYLNVYPTDTWYFGNYSDGTTGTVEAGSNWKMSGIDSSWLTVSPSSGEGGYDRSSNTFKTTAVEYKTAENTEPVPRTCVITVSCPTDLPDIPELTMTQTFMQSGITPEFSVEIPSDISGSTYAAKGSTLDVSYTTNIKPEYLSVRTDAANCSATCSDGTMHIIIGENPDANRRTITFYVYAQETPITNFSFRQYGATAYWSTSSIQIEAAGGTASATVSAAQSWSLVLPDGCDWLTVSPMSGDAIYGGTEVTFNASANSTGSTRAASVSICNNAGNVLASLSVTQESITADADTRSFYNLSARGETRTMQLTFPGSWKATPDVDWITVSPNSATATAYINGEITFTIAPNKSSSATRYGNVVFTGTSAGDATSLTIAFSQKGAAIGCTTDITIPATDDGSYATINVISDVDWEVIGNPPSWCSIYPTSGSAGETAVRVSTAENNPSLTGRSGTIEIGLAGTTITAKCTVYQSGRQMVSGQSEINVDWREYPALPLEIEVPGEWVASASENWITVSPAAGTGNATINVHIEANAGANARYGVISITSESVTTNIPVNQGGRILNIETTAGEIGAMGGSTEFSVSATVEYTTRIDYGEGTTDWLTLTDISADGITAYRVTAIANPSVNDREAYVELVSEDTNNVQFSVKQRGRDIRLSALEISISGNGGTTEDIVVDADGEYSVTTEDTWFSIIKGTNNNFHLAVTPNTTGSNRRGTITVSLTDVADGESKSVTVTVKQSTSPVDFGLGDFGSDQDWN